MAGEITDERSGRRPLRRSTASTTVARGSQPAIDPSGIGAGGDCVEIGEQHADQSSLGVVWARFPAV